MGRGGGFVGREISGLMKPNVARPLAHQLIENETFEAIYATDDVSEFSIEARSRSAGDESCRLRGNKCR